MKVPAIAAIACLLPFLSSCGKKEASPENTASLEDQVLKAADTPLLPLRPGDSWEYKVSVEVPAGVTSPSAAAVAIDQRKTRVYKGKVFVAEGGPETDAFDVSVPGEPVEREFVDIHEDRILMRGSSNPETPGSEPIWLDPPVPFVVAGLRAGQAMASLGVQDGARKRDLQVVAREKVTVAAGEYENAIRLLMTGNDGEFEVRRTTWFVPRVGIVKEEKTRYLGDKLLFRETMELIKTTVTGARK